MTVETLEIGEIRGKHVGKIVTINGAVKTIANLQRRCTIAVFECKRCGTSIMVNQGSGALEEPTECNTDQGGCSKTYGQTKFKWRQDLSEFTDTQDIELEEVPGYMRPRAIIATIEGDLVESVRQGQKVMMTGTVGLKIKKSHGKPSVYCDLQLHVTEIKVIE